MKNQGLTYELSKIGRNFAAIIVAAFLIILLSPYKAASQESTIDQKLVVKENAGLTGGVFAIEYQIKGTNVGTTTTLASLNADLIYDTTKIRFTSGSNWNIETGEENGYVRSVQSNSSESGNLRAVRVTLIAASLNDDGSGMMQGFNISNDYIAILRVNFIILQDNQSVTITIKEITNQAGLFTNFANNPNNFEISNRNLSTPIHIQDEPLPVTLASFTSNISGRDVRLNWVTTYEQNNAGFEIERKNEIGNWIKIGYIAGNNNSNSPKNYTFSDSKLESGKYNYRLRQIDNNGNFEYHALSNKVEISVPGKYSISQNYPNPFNPSTKIDFEVPNDAKVTVKIFDMTGKEVGVLLNGTIYKAGYHTITYNASNLSSGTYFYQFIIDCNGKQISESKKMTVLK